MVTGEHSFSTTYKNQSDIHNNYTSGSSITDTILQVPHWLATILIGHGNVMYFRSIRYFFDRLLIYPRGRFIH